MTCRAINGRFLLLVTIDAIAHGQINGADGNRLLPHIAVAGSAGYVRPNVRGVIEFYMGGRAEIIHALPGNIFAAGHVCSYLLDFRSVRSDHLVTSHTKFHAGNNSVRSSVNPDMAICALHAVCKVHFMSVSHGLDRYWPTVKKVLDSLKHGWVSWAKDTWSLRLRLSPAALGVCRRRSLE